MRRFLIGGLMGTGLAVACVIGLFSAATCRPTWYVPPLIESGRLEADKRDLTNLLDRIGGELNARKPIEIEIDEAQLNHWVAARRELPQGETIDFGPFRDPMIDFRAEGVFVGATVEQSGVQTVVSARLNATVEEGVLRLSFGSVGLGRVTVPRMTLDRALRDAIRGTELERALQADGSIVIPNQFVWPNGKVPMRVVSVQSTDRSVRIRLEPR